jgi:hypothetical protein
MARKSSVSRPAGAAKPHEEAGRERGDEVTRLAIVFLALAIAGVFRVKFGHEMGYLVIGVFVAAPRIYVTRDMTQPKFQDDPGTR